MRRIGQTLSVLGILVLALAILASAFGLYTVRRAYPQTQGTLKLPGLSGPVDIYRDSLGVPHIYADNPHDLFMAQGFVHSQDRFYQMDFWRHQTAGRLSELYGEGQAEKDRFLRAMGWHLVAAQEYAQASPDTKVILDAYAAGVNAYIGSRSAADLSLEYSILGLIGLSNYIPEPWTPVDSLAWAKAMAWDLGGNMDGEINRAILYNLLGEEKAQEILPFYPFDLHPVIVPTPAVGSRPVDPAQAVVLDPASVAVLQDLRAQTSQVAGLFGGRFEGIGSNDWVISGSRTTTGMPLLADDPHLAIQMPAIWYQVGLHCRTVSRACPYDVTGFSLAGDPGIIIGHNQRIAWGVTNVGPDVQDLYIERINPANPNQYEVNGEWVDMAERNEVIRYRDGGWETYTVRSTRHGPIITDIYGLEEFAQQAGLDPQYQYAFALRWTALEPGRVFESVLGLNRAGSFDEFRTALRDWTVPSQNFVYADVDGNIGYQTPSNIPIRRNGDGLLPVPGWTDEYEWTGYIPFEELPYSYNPPQGYIATANNAVVGPDYPYLIELSWDPGYRARRIVDMIEAQPEISPEYIQQMHADNMNLGAQDILPYLLELSFDDPELAKALDGLHGWDYQMHMDSQPAAVYMGFLNALVKNTFYDELPSDLWSGGGPDDWLALRSLLQNPQSSWWDNVQTSTVETRDDILRASFEEGFASLKARLGGETQTWKWGDLHTSTFTNQTLGRSGVSVIEALFNRGGFRTSGGSGVVNATGWDLSNDDCPPDDADCSPGDPYAVRSLPSMRMIVDLSDLSNSRVIHTTGQSGHPYHPHYIDMADMWRRIEYAPMLFDRATIEQQAEAHLVLEP